MEKGKLTKTEKLKRRKKRNEKRSQLRKQLEEIKAKRKEGILLIVLGIFLFGFFGHLWLNRNEEIKKEDLITIEGTSNNNLEIKRKKGHERFMTIEFSEYPRNNFRLGQFALKKLKNRSLQKNTTLGDKIFIDILKEDHVNILNKKEKNIFVYGVRDASMEYLNVDGVNWATKKERNSILTYLFLGLSFCSILYGVYLYRNNTKKIAANKHETF